MADRAQRKMSLRFQIMMCLVLVILAVVGVLSAIALSLMNRRIAEDIEARTYGAMRVGTRIFIESLPIFSVVPDRAGEPESLKLTFARDALSNYGPELFQQAVDGVSGAVRNPSITLLWDADAKRFTPIATANKKNGKEEPLTLDLTPEAVASALAQGWAYRGPMRMNNDIHQVALVPMVDVKGERVGLFVVSVGSIDALTAATYALMKAMLLAGGALVLLFALVLPFLVARLLRPLRAVADVTMRLSEGQTDIRVPHQDRTDEIGILARAVEHFREAVVARLSAEAEKAHEAARLAANKLEMDRAIAAFRAGVGQSLGDVRQGVAGVMRNVEGMRSAAHSASARVFEGVEAARGGKEAITEVATATHQFSASISEIAHRTHAAANVVEAARAQGGRAEEVSRDLVSAVGRIATSVGIISAIASQTNLLALNANVEAARAGDSGKGFTVVANEVKQLSSGTAQAANDIAQLVKSIEGVSGAVHLATREIGNGLVNIGETTHVVAAAVAEQEQVTLSIAANAQSAAERSDVILGVFDSVAEAVEGTASAADALDALSKVISGSTERLVADIEGFLARMAAQEAQ